MYPSGKRARTRTPVTKYSQKKGRSAPAYAVGGVPAGQRVTMKYSQQVFLSDAIIGLSEQVFRAGSIYDPDLSGTGEQPLGHDQWATLYQKYRVLGSRIKVMGKNIKADADGSAAVTFCICQTNGTAAILDAATCIEQSYSNWTMLGNSDGAAAVGTLNMKSLNQATVKGDYGAKYDNDYTAGFGSNPVEDSYYHIIAKSEGSASVEVRIRVLIEYDVWVFDPVQLLES